MMPQPTVSSAMRACTEMKRTAMDIIRSVSQTSDSGHAIIAARLNAARLLSDAKQKIILQLISFRHFMQQPIMTALGVLAAGGAAKSGHGGWAAGVILTS